MRLLILFVCLAVNCGGCHRESAQRMTRGSAEGHAGAALPVLSIGDAQIIEGKGGTPVVRFYVTLSAASMQSVTVHYATEDATALADRDYRPASGTLVFPPNSNAAQGFDVTIIGDAVASSPKTFAATLSAPVNASIAGRRASATIGQSNRGGERQPRKLDTLKARTHSPS
jgi:Calx-beta domain